MVPFYVLQIGSGWIFFLLNDPTHKPFLVHGKFPTDVTNLITLRMLESSVEKLVARLGGCLIQRIVALDR